MNIADFYGLEYFFFYLSYSIKSKNGIVLGIFVEYYKNSKTKSIGFFK